MGRYRLTIEYDGTTYNGFQAQADDQPTIQASLERAILAFSGEATRVQTAGRTDSGVHATGQVVHVDLTKDWRGEVVRDAMNAYLRGEAIVVLDALAVDEDFHARFGATERRYLYRILNRWSPAGLERHHVWHMRRPLDARAMHDAAQVLLGFHDFTTFRDLACQANSPMRTLDMAEVRREGDEIHLRFAARSFLHRQVRSITGSLAEVGLGRWTAADLQAALDAKDRRACGPVAPASGLYLTGVTYGEARGS
jgi:tRNA pseudouridine38-40 synthase